MRRQYIWRHRGWWGVNTYGVIVGGGASIHMASQGAVGRQYIWCHRGWWNVNTYGVIKGGGASIHMAS